MWTYIHTLYICCRSYIMTYKAQHDVFPGLDSPFLSLLQPLCFLFVSHHSLYIFLHCHSHFLVLAFFHRFIFLDVWLAHSPPPISFSTPLECHLCNEAFCFGTEYLSPFGKFNGLKSESPKCAFRKWVLWVVIKSQRWSFCFHGQVRALKLHRSKTDELRSLPCGVGGKWAFTNQG